MNRDEMIARAISVLDTAGIVKKDKNPEKLYMKKRSGDRFHPLVRLWKWEVIFVCSGILLVPRQFAY